MKAEISFKIIIYNYYFCPGRGLNQSVRSQPPWGIPRLKMSALYCLIMNQKMMFTYKNILQARSNRTCALCLYEIWYAAICLWEGLVYAYGLNVIDPSWISCVVVGFQLLSPPHVLRNYKQVVFRSDEICQQPLDLRGTRGSLMPPFCPHPQLNPQQMELGERKTCD